MTVTIELKPETEKRLAEMARRNGLPIEDFIEDFIEENLDESEETSHKTASQEEWNANFERFLNSRKDTGYPLLSDEALRRENIYEDRF